MSAFTINRAPVGILTDEAFNQLCQANPNVNFEHSAQGELIIMSSTGGESGRRNAAITADLTSWNRRRTGEMVCKACSPKLTSTPSATH